MLTIIDFQTKIPNAETKRFIKFTNSSSQNIEDEAQQVVRNAAIAGDTPVSFVAIAKAEVRRAEVTRYHVLESKSGERYSSTLDVVSLEDLPNEWSSHAWETLRGLENLYFERCIHTLLPQFVKLYRAATAPAEFLPKFEVVDGEFSNTEHLRYGSEYRVRVEVAARKDAYLAELSKFACERKLFPLVHGLERRVSGEDVANMHPLVRILKEALDDGGDDKPKEVDAEVAAWLCGEFEKCGLNPSQRVFA